MNAGDIIERYRLIEPLGEGGMGSVWLAEHVTLRGRHALKVLDRHLLADATIRERFLEEGRIQASLVHPAIVRVTDLVTTGVAGLVMDFVPGPDLGEWLESHGPASPHEARVILSILLNAVALAHDRGIVHRDLKPANVLMRGGSLAPVIVDFGIAKVVTEGGKGRTRTGTSMGTPGYMAPEQVRDASNADRRSDVYSLGVILHELLSGVPRFRGDSDFDVMRAVVDGEASPLPSGLEPGLAECVRRATLADPSGRFQTAAEFLTALGRDGPACPSCGTAVPLSSVFVAPARSSAPNVPAAVDSPIAEPTPAPRPVAPPPRFDLVLVDAGRRSLAIIKLLRARQDLDGRDPLLPHRSA